MYNPLLTQSELNARGIFLVDGLLQDAQLGKLSEILNDQIKTHLASDELRRAIKGQRYYECENDITKRILQYSWDGNIFEDKNASNVKKAHAFAPLIVDQKVSYIAGREPALISDDQRFIESFKSVFGPSARKVLMRLVKRCSNHGRTYLHPYVEESTPENPIGRLRIKTMDSREIIPIYDTRFQDEMVAAIRYYPLFDVNNGQIKSGRYSVEIWTQAGTIFLEQQDNGQFIPDITYERNPLAHFYTGRTRSETQIGQSWGKLPLIEIRNNDECQTDLNRILPLIDDYDLTNSDFSNNLIDLADALTVIKGFSMDPTEAREWIKVKKVVPIPDKDGGVDLVTLDIPYEAREANSQRLRNDIFAFSQAYDPTEDRLGNNLSGVALKFLYGPLDQKSAKLIVELNDAMAQLAWFVAEYEKRVNDNTFNIDDFKVIWNLSQVVNEQEAIENNQKSMGLVSDETRIANHPWVDDVTEEIERINEQNTVDLADGLVE